MAGRIRVVVVEDEPQARQNLRDFLTDLDWLVLVGEAADGKEAVGLIDELEPELVFLDVGLPVLGGLEVVSRLRHQAEIVFTTAHDEFALVAFEIGAIDYLLKPFGRDRFLAALDRVRRRIPAASVPVSERARSAFDFPVRRLFARTPRGIVPVDVHSIRHLRASGDYVEVYCDAGKYLLHTGLAELAQRLDPGSFLQVHRSHVVNLDAVELLSPYDDRRLLVQLRDGTRVVASRSASERLRNLAR